MATIPTTDLRDGPTRPSAISTAEQVREAARALADNDGVTDYDAISEQRKREYEAAAQEDLTS